MPAVIDVSQSSVFGQDFVATAFLGSQKVSTSTDKAVIPSNFLAALRRASQQIDAGQYVTMDDWKAR